MAYAILGTPKPQFFDSSGSPLASGTVTVYDAGTSNAKATYPTADDANASTNGVSTAYTLDSRGEIATQLWGKDGEDYKVVVADSAAANIYTIDDIRLPPKSRRAAVTFDSSDATPTIAESNLFRATDTTAITDFDDGQVGDIITVHCLAASKTITHNASIIALASQSNFNMRTGDTLTLAMFTDQIWTEIGRTTSSPKYESVTSFTNTLTAAESGTTYFLNLAGGGSTVLPLPALGLNYKFIVATAPTTAYTIDTNGGANIMHGTHVDITAAGSEILVYFTAQDILSFVANTSLIGDILEVVSDGTSWFCKARTGAANGITTGQT